MFSFSFGSFVHGFRLVVVIVRFVVVQFLVVDEVVVDFVVDVGTVD